MTDEERTPPARLRVTGLQEAQLPKLIQLERDCAQLHHEAGVPADAIQPRGEDEISMLPRRHDVMVVEADHQPAAYLAWKDEAPGVAWLPVLAVAPEFQRFGIGTRLLRELGEATTKHGITHCVAVSYSGASWAMSFLGARGFMPVSAGNLPDKVAAWLDERGDAESTGGRMLWWRETDGLGTIPGLPRPS